MIYPWLALWCVFHFMVRVVSVWFVVLNPVGLGTRCSDSDAKYRGGV